MVCDGCARNARMTQPANAGCVEGDERNLVAAKQALTATYHGDL